MLKSLCFSSVFLKSMWVVDAGKLSKRVSFFCLQETIKRTDKTANQRRDNKRDVIVINVQPKEVKKRPNKELFSLYCMMMLPFIMRKRSDYIRLLYSA